MTAMASWAAEPVPVKKPLIVLISGEYEYDSRETLPAFKKYLEKNYPLECIYIERPEPTNMMTIPKLEVLDRADLAVIFIRRMTLPEDQLNRFKRFVDAGKPVVGLRTASHAFENWKEWDHDVLGGNYHNHTRSVGATIEIIPEAAGHPILNGVERKFLGVGSLYRNEPLAEGSTPLLIGTIKGEPTEPVAWTHRYHGGRMFYTSLGHPDDFENESFKKLVVNAIFYGLNRPVPGAKTR